MSVPTQHAEPKRAGQAQPALPVQPEPVPAQAEATAPPEDSPAVAAPEVPAKKARRKLMRQTELVDRVKAYDPDADEALDVPRS